MPKAYSYVRFSSPEQAKGDSYRRQKEAAEAYCAANGLELASSAEYTFFDRGRSAYKGRHVSDDGELARFLALVNEGAIEKGSTLIVESLDRLSREKVKDALPRFLDLLNGGINVYTSADGRLYTSDYNELDLIISIVHMSRAHNESALKGDRVGKAWAQKQELARTHRKPLGRVCPYWLRLEDGKYKPIPDRVEVVRRVYQLSATGYGGGSIAQRLNADDVPVFGSERRNSSGKWSPSSVKKLLNNRALIGEYQPTKIIDGKRQNIGEPVAGFFPVVIEPDEFYAVQAAQSTRRVSGQTRNTTNFNVWQGIAKCSRCGGPMHLIDKGTPPKGAKYLQCYNVRKGVCKNKIVRLDRSEEVFREVLAKVDSLALIQDDSKAIAQKLATVEGRLVDGQKRYEIAAEAQLNFPSLIGAQLLQQQETELAELKAEQQRLLEDQSRQQITNKDEFFAKLDLVTYEGRNAANALLKRLDLKVFITSTGPKWAKYDLGKEQPQPLKGKFPMVSYQQGPDHLHIEANTSEHLNAAIVQGNTTKEDLDAEWRAGFDE